MIYANNAGTSWPKPEAVHQAAAAALAAAPKERDGLFARAQDEVARFLGLPHPERLLLAPGCTAALAVAIGDLPWEAGDVVVTSALEHHALARPVEKLVRERGVRHEVIPYRPGVPFDLAAAEAVLGRGRVRLVALTAASNVTGEVLPVAEAAALAHEHQALCLIDAAQVVGVLPFDVAALGADLVAFAGHKGALGPQGIGGLWAAPEVTFASPWASCEVGGGERPPCSPMPGYCDVGSVNLAGAAGLAAGLRWLRERGPAAGEGPRALAARLVAALRERPGCRVLGGDGPRTATVSLLLDGLALADSEAHFAAQGVLVRAGQHCAPLALAAVGAPAGTVRISFGSFNGEEDVEAVLRAVDAVRAP